MTKCKVELLIRSFCSEDCPDWEVCPIVKAIQRENDRHAAYDPEPKEAEP